MWIHGEDAYWILSYRILRCLRVLNLIVVNTSKVKMTANVLVFGKDVEDGVNGLLLEKETMLL